MRAVTAANVALIALLFVSCGGEERPTGPSSPGSQGTGSILVSVVISGGDTDADGCTVTVDSGPGQLLVAGGTAAFSRIPTGSHLVTIGGVASNCRIEGGVSRNVTVSEDRTTYETFAVLCDWRSRVSFVRSYDIWVMNPDGSQQYRLSNHAGDASGPIWSPDGTRIVYELGCSCGKDDSYAGDIWTMNADGTGQSQLTFGFLNASEDPTWSPDGTRIAYRYGFDIYVMNADGTEQTNLTNHPERDSAPAWSPEGSRIAFVCRRGGDLHICAMNVDGTEPVQLTDTPHDDLNQHPKWSPDGSRIAFHRGAQIYAMNPDGTGEVLLGSGRGPTWSPDGNHIAFQCHRGAGLQICVLNSDGSAELQLTDSPDEDLDPKWSPDGTRIAFTRRGPCGQPRYCQDIFAVRADGTGERRLTNFMGDYLLSSRAPDWSPDLY